MKKTDGLLVVSCLNAHDSGLLREVLETSEVKIRELRVVSTPGELSAAVLQSDAVVVVAGLDEGILDANAILLLWEGLTGLPPLLVVTHSNHEEEAAEVVRRGAAEYVLMEHLIHLPITLAKLVKIAKLRKEALKSNQQLKIQQSYIESVFNITNDLLLVIDNQSCLLVFNKVFVRWCQAMHGVNPVVGQSVFSIIHPETTRLLKPAFEQALTGEEVQVQHTYQLDDGLHYYETTFHPIIENGNTVGVTSRTHDITRRMTQLLHLSQTEKELRLKNQLDQCFLTADDEMIHQEVLKVLSDTFHTNLNLLGFIEKGSDVFEIDTVYTTPGTQGQLPQVSWRFAKSDWRGIWGRALRQQKPFIQEDGFNVPEGHPEVIRSLMAPILFKGDLVGFLHLANKPSPFTHNDLDLLVAVAAHLGPIFTARLGRKKEMDQRKETERALKESQRRLQTLMNNLPGMAYLCTNDPEWTMEFVSAGCYKLTGYEPEALLGNAYVSYTQLILPQYQQYLWEKWQGVLCRREVFTDTYQIQTATGEVKWVWEQGQGVYNFRDELVALEGFIVDITEQHEVQKRIDESEKKFRLLFESMAQGVVFQDISGAIVAANPAAVKILGLDTNSIMGKASTDPSWLAVHEDETPFPGNEHPAMVALHTGQKVENVIMGIVNQTTHERRWININAVPIFDENSRHPGFVFTTFDDITQMQQAALEVRQARDEAQAANKLKDAFIANISHEIRTPLNALLGFSDLLLDQFSEAPGHRVEKFVQSINTAGLRLMRSMDLILNYSRTQTGEYPTIKQTIDLQKMVESQIADYLQAAQLRRINLLLEARCPNTSFEGDEYSLKIAIDNLLDNALKYTHQGEVKVSIYCNGEHLNMDVADTGIGMTDEFQQKLFTPYTQEDTGPDRAYEGLGLGLSLTRKLLEYNNATITVKSKKGEGSVFTVTFLNTSPNTQPTTKEINKNTNEMKKIPVVLVVEDDASSQYYMEVVLQKAYNPVIVATDKEAFEVLRNEDVALVLMDISLKESANGLDITRMIKQNPSTAHIPVVALTAHAFPADKQRSLEAGCDDYVSKPVKKDDLYKIIDKFLG